MTTMSSDAPRQLPYDLPSDPAKRHSAALTDGPDRAAARGMLKAIGFDDKDLARPIIGVATTWIETMPCNYNQRRPGGRRDADGVQHDRCLGRHLDGH
jgi:dihydroxyacid dehydratase/phosphogluconate dehydratase